MFENEIYFTVCQFFFSYFSILQKMSGKTTNETEAPLSDDYNDEEKQNEEKPFNESGDIQKNDVETVDFNTAYFDDRTNRFFYLSIIAFFVFFNYFICTTTTDQYILEEANERTEQYLSWINGRLIGSMLICVACLGVWFMKYKQSDLLNDEEDRLKCGMNVQTLVGLLFIGGGISLLVSTIKVFTTGMDVAQEFLSDEEFKCGNFTKNELINYKTGVFVFLYIVFFL